MNGGGTITRTVFDPRDLDLKTATVQTWNAGAWQTIDNNYYRYWTFDGGGGLWHGLKYVLGSTAYDRMVLAGLNPLTATDAQLAGYSDKYFEYDVSSTITTVSC